jgi:tripartite-type tricarboxylate transporter receptor subunit TctC
MTNDLLARQISAGGTIAPDLFVGGAERYRDLPDLPTFKEAGFQCMKQMTMWGALAVAAGTPDPLLQRLRAAMRRVLLQSRTAEKLHTTGNYVDYAGHEALARRQAADLKF